MKISRCHSWGSALVPNPLTPPNVGRQVEARSCSVGSQTDLLTEFAPEIRLGRSDMMMNIITLCSGRLN